MRKTTKGGLHSTCQRQSLNDETKWEITTSGAPSVTQSAPGTRISTSNNEEKNPEEQNETTGGEGNLWQLETT